MVKDICLIIAFYLVAKEVLPGLAVIVLELIHMAIFRVETPKYLDIKERSIRIKERQREMKDEMHREMEMDKKRPIGFHSENIES